MKKNDVYTFRYNEKETKKRFEPYHCFDGTLIVREGHEGQYLEDTYWSSNNRTFTQQEAQEEGTLTFVCNLDEVEEVREDQEKYYDEADFITLRIHAGYRNKHFIRKGALRSQAKMLKTLKGKLEEAEYKKTSAETSIKRIHEDLKKVEAGDTSIYI